MKIVKIIMLTFLVSVSTIAIICTDNSEYYATALGKFKSYGELKEFLQRRRAEYGLGPSAKVFTEGSDALNALGGLPDYSGTNIQVEGVDEADIVKTDGEYIYVIADQKVVIVRAYPPEEAAVLSKITVDERLKQIFVNERRLVVFSENGSWTETQTFINVYDVSDGKTPVLVRDVAVDGFYSGSRMIGDYVYAVIRKDASIIEGEVTLPKFYSDGEFSTISATDVYYSDIVDYGYVFTTVLAINVQDDEQPPTYGPILSGWSTNIYVSQENIYLAISYIDKTVLHRIHIENGVISHAADGEVLGAVLNQFSMDEYKGYFRIATTSRIISSFKEPSRLLNTQNNLYTLNMDLEVIGKLEDVAPGEKIYSARFMGDLCYLVTFRKIDPFFVIDLSNPYNPEILGELKITGYSDYLHLYDENHVIGIGKETFPAEEGDFSWYQGVKISLFDVTDVSKPEELAKYEIGDRGTDSPVLTEHKAFLFDREKNLLVMPVSVAKIDESRYSYGVPPNAFGERVWQGAYVFTISLTLEEKIILKGTVTHVEDGDVRNTSLYIARTLYIGDVLYTISNSKIKMNSLSDLSEVNELNLNE